MDGRTEVDHVYQEEMAAAIAAARYGIIIDAGSSGSRLRMFEIQGDKVAGIMPSSADEQDFEIEPGIASYAERPGDAGPSLESLLRAAQRYIHVNDHNQTVLWVKATAGMRIVREELLSVLLDRLDAWMAKHCPFKYVNSEVLGGEEEALFAYISMNYLKGTLFDKPEVRVGILDMGGASVQMAHHPKKFVLAEEYSFYVHGQRRTVYATSQIKFGLATAMERAFGMLARSEEFRTDNRIPFPCYQKGVNVTHWTEGRSITFFGTGSNFGCSELTNTLLHRDYVCLMPPCSFMGIHMAPFAPNKRFYGISNYFYIANGLGLVGWDEERAITPLEIRTAAESLCEQSGEQAASEGPPWKYRINHCFGGHYMSNILDAYHFSQQADNIVFLRLFRGNQKTKQAADWSLGAILYETQAMPLFLPTDREVCKHRVGSRSASSFLLPEAKFDASGGVAAGLAPASSVAPAGWMPECLWLTAGAFAGAFVAMLLWNFLHLGAAPRSGCRRRRLRGFPALVAESRSAATSSHDAAAARRGEASARPLVGPPCCDVSEGLQLWDDLDDSCSDAWL